MKRRFAESVFEVLTAFLAVSVVLPLRAAPVLSAADSDFYENKVRPILVENCYKCHSHEAEKVRGGLMLDSLAGALKGGGTAPAVVPGQPDESLLLRAVSYADPDLRMPPKNKRLSAGQIATLTDWIKRGAPWPGRQPAMAVRPRGKITDEDRQWWSFQPVKEPIIPQTDDRGWARNPIDKFIEAKLEAEGLKPSPEAGRETLIRRVCFDLTGLPPTPQEVDEFVADRSKDAYERLIDRLLASPRYGERWARHWLDLARYAESDGYKADDYRPNVWRYRDYVIRSFNEDKPYDLFLQEQLAGDELWPERPEAVVATSFLRLGIYEYNNRDVRLQWTAILNDLTDVSGDLFLGLGVQCARCHDHKFDPILQKDYYRLQAFFAPILPREDLVAATRAQKEAYEGRLAHWKERAGSVLSEIEALEKPYRERAAAGAIKKFDDDLQSVIAKPGAARTPLDEQIYQLAYRQVTYEYAHLDAAIKGADKEKLAALRKKLAEFEDDKPEPLPSVLGATDVGPEAPPVYLPKDKTKHSIEPGFLTVLDEKPAVITPVPTAPNSTGRRTALVRWLTCPDNPLTARVIVNRLWQYHFGRGLVATSSDFGHLGERPSHPELLDWLAARFVKDGWSLKKTHKLLLMSAVYRQASVVPTPELARLKDPENRLLWRMNILRLEAEEIRDSILAATGELDLKMGGPAVDYAAPRRTIYARVTRNTRDPLLDVFDSPENFASVSQRNTTTTPTQALLLINSETVFRRASSFAARLRREHPKSATDQVSSGYRLAFGRAPTKAELQAGVGFLEAQGRRLTPAGPEAVPLRAEPLTNRERPGGESASAAPAGAGHLDPEPRQSSQEEGRAEAGSLSGANSDPQWQALVDFCHVLLNANEFFYVD